MRPISAWAHLMSATVTIAARTGQDVNGKPTYSTAPATYRAHIGRKQQMVRTSTEQEVASERTVWLATADAIQESARLTLSTADTGSTEAAVNSPPIVAVERLFDQNGPHHTVLYLALLLCVRLVT